MILYNLGGQSSKPFNYDEQLANDTRGPYSVEVKDDNQPANAGIKRRNATSPDQLVTRIFTSEDGGYGTLHDLFQRSVKKHPNSKFLGTRRYELDDQKQYVLKEKAPVRKEFVWETYAEVCMNTHTYIHTYTHAHIHNIHNIHNSTHTFNTLYLIHDSCRLKYESRHPTHLTFYLILLCVDSLNLIFIIICRSMHRLVLLVLV